MYKLTNMSCVIRTEDLACIPVDDSNADYQEYLLWKNNGGIPQEADVLVNPRVPEILSKLVEIDLKSVRPLRAIVSGNQTSTDVQTLSQLTTEAEALRTELATYDVVNIQ